MEKFIELIFTKVSISQKSKQKINQFPSLPSFKQVCRDLFITSEDARRRGSIVCAHSLRLHIRSGLLMH